MNVVVSMIFSILYGRKEVDKRLCILLILVKLFIDVNLEVSGLYVWSWSVDGMGKGRGVIWVYNNILVLEVEWLNSLCWYEK